MSFSLLQSYFVLYCISFLVFFSLLLLLYSFIVLDLVSISFCFVTSHPYLRFFTSSSLVFLGSVYFFYILFWCAFLFYFTSIPSILLCLILVILFLLLFLYLLFIVWAFPSNNSHLVLFPTSFPFSTVAAHCFLHLFHFLSRVWVSPSNISLLVLLSTSIPLRLLVPILSLASYFSIVAEVNVNSR